MAGRNNPREHDTGERKAQSTETRQREEGVELRPDFDKLGGLVTAVAQDAATGEVLMVAFMNREAFAATRSSGFAHYYSRSRRRIWKKGETSGNLQEVSEILVDCDQDAVVLRVRQHGDGACHTGRFTCFYRRISGDGLAFRGEPAGRIRRDPHEHQR